MGEQRDCEQVYTQESGKNPRARRHLPWAIVDCPSSGQPLPSASDLLSYLQVEKGHR